MRWLNLGWILILLGFAGGASSPPAPLKTPGSTKPDTEEQAAASNGSETMERSADRIDAPGRSVDLEDSSLAWIELGTAYSEAFGASTRTTKDSLYGLFAEKLVPHRTLIALVPDPVESHLEAQFDQVVSGIRRAFATESYQLDRFWFPWPTKQTEAARTEFPGLLLFRKTVDGKTGFFSVFLVGENTAKGVLPGPFRTAVDLAAPPRSDPKRTLDIIGPTFSGSAFSLRRELTRIPDKTAVRIISGSATATSLSRDLALKDLFFDRTLLDDCEVSRRAYLFLSQHLGWRFGQAALISEGDSVYGQDFPGTRNSKPCPGPSPQFSIRFPSGLAELRAEWSEESQPPPGLRGLALSLLRSIRPLDLHVAADRRPSDVVPQLGTTTGVTNDLALGDLLRVGCGASLQYVGLVATDVRDRLALARRIRERCPRVVLFTFGSDLLTLHPNAARDLEGLVVITASPMETQGRTQWKGRKPLEQFASDTEEGVFLAALRFIRSEGIRIHLIPQTPVRIAVISSGALVPIALLTKDGVNPTEAPPLSEIIVELLPWLIVLAVSALAFRHGVKRSLAGSSLLEISEFVPLLVGRGALFALTAMLLAIVTCLELSEIAEQSSFTWFFRVAFGMAIGAVFCWLQWWHQKLGRVAPILLGSALFCTLVLSLLSEWMSGGVGLFLTRLDASILSTPLPSLLLVVGAALAWAYQELERRHLGAEHGIDWKIEGPDSLLAHCVDSGADIRSAINRVFPPNQGTLATATVAAVMSFFLWGRVQPISESVGYGRFFVLLTLAVCLLAASSFVRFAIIWKSLKELLDRLRLLGLEKQLDRLKDEIDWKPMRAFATPPVKLRMTWLTLKTAKRIERSEALRPLYPLEAGQLQQLEDRMLAAQRAGNPSNERGARRELQIAFDQILSAYTGSQWSRRSEVTEMICLRATAFFRHAISQMRSSLLAALIPGFLLLAAAATYAFQPKGVLFLALWIALLVATLRTIWTLVEMDRDPVLSAIGGTKPGEVEFTKTFLGNTLTYGVLPLVGLAILQFPQLGIYVSRLLAPFYQIIPLHH